MKKPKESEEETSRRLRWPLHADGSIDKVAAMTTLARSFPTLQTANGIHPWNVADFVHWLCSDIPGTSAALAGRFLLSVWDPEAEWVDYALAHKVPGAHRAKRFDALEAAGHWDHAHRMAFAVWFDAPFWP